MKKSKKKKSLTEDGMEPSRSREIGCRPWFEVELIIEEWKRRWNLYHGIRQEGLHFEPNIQSIWRRKEAFPRETIPLCTRSVRKTMKGKTWLGN